MYRVNFNKRTVLVFRRFGNKGYSLFACLGREVVCSVLSVATLTYASAESVSTSPVTTDSATIGTARTQVLDEVQVTGSRAPLTALQSAKVVTVITHDDIQRAPVTSINDLFKQATGVDVRQRGGFGVQTDISINGGTFDQQTILLNGVNISNPQTGHNASDFPVSLNDIERIEVLEGAAARLFGSSAFSGAINIVTRKPKTQEPIADNLRVSIEGGSYGTFGSEAGMQLQKGSLYTLASAGYTRSDGGVEHSDFKKGRFFYHGSLNHRQLAVNWQLGATSQSYGANTFYSAKYNDQYEKTRHLIASASADYHTEKWHITPTLYYNRFYDHYQLIRGQQGAQAGENYHRVDVGGASVNASVRWPLGISSVGADLRKEHILSTVYGEPLAKDETHSISGSDRYYDHEGQRTNLSIFLEHNIILNSVTLSAGVLANRNTGLDDGLHFYPGIDVAWRPDDHWKLYASWNKALRLPTYTDLYSGNAVLYGDCNLKPERNSMFKLGVQGRFSVLTLHLSTFYSRGRDMIDWVYETETSTRYHALNIGQLDNMGYSVDLSLQLPAHIMLRTGYAYISQRHDTEKPIYRSLYALEYLRHKVTTQLDIPIWRQLSASWTLRWQERMNGYTPYFKVDAKLQWQSDRFEIYVKGDNLTNHSYYDLGGVRQPGLWLMAGCTLHIR